MKRTLSIGLSCAIGAGIGTILALNLGGLWPFGLLLGALTGYLIFDYKKVVYAIPKAWDYARQRKKIKTKDFFFALTGAIIPVAASVMLCIGIATSVMMNTSSDVGLIEAYLFGGILSFITFLFWAIHNLIFLEKGFEEVYKPRRLKISSKIWKDDMDHTINEVGDYYMNLAAKVASGNIAVTCVFFALGPIPLIGMLITICFVQVIKITRSFGKFVARFVYKLFILIHSDLRLLVGVDALIGGLVGYIYLSPLVGMAVGAVGGIFNYWIVSIKILKLKHS